MKPTFKLFLLTILIACISSCKSGNSESESGPYQPSIIPQPQSMELSKGSFPINSSTKILYPDVSLKPMAELLENHIYNLTSFDLKTSKGDEAENSILLKLDATLEAKTYNIDIDKNAVLTGGSYNALSNASASLIQLINQDKKKFTLPYINIIDKPDYEYRAVMLDLARFWHPIETIRETIDMLWYYKIPYLQLHLSDNRRFTFPMDEYPDLKKVLDDGSREYYTKEELTDLVQYAEQRGVAIIPEIDLPGHSGQLFTKYPDTFGTIDPETGKAKYMHVINIAKEECYTACESIINQLAEVFYTSPYIHFGGDEVYLEVLKQVPEYKSYCKKHGLEEALKGNAQELFCHFINELHGMVKETGKKTIIWEGFHGDGAGKVKIDKDITVIVWNTTYNHPKTLIDHGFSIVNSTWIPWYMVGAMNLAPPPDRAYEWDLNNWSHWNENLEEVNLETKDGLIGGQICYWEQNYYMVVPVLRPRTPILAEKLWNNDLEADYDGFNERLKQTENRYSELFRPIEMDFNGLTNEDDLRFIDVATVKLSSLTDGNIKWAIDENWGIPDIKEMTDYKEDIRIKNSSILTAQLVDNNGIAIGYPVQKYLQKIDPVYEYTAYGPAPITGWKEMPDFDTLGVIRSGLMGRMNKARLKKINGELFAKVKEAGHIDIRMNGVYNQYALELNGSISIEETNDYLLVLQTHDGLAELYIDDELVAKGTEFGNKPQEFTTSLKQGEHKIRIKYFYKSIQNQLSIMYKIADDDSELQAFENLVKTL